MLAGGDVEKQYGNLFVRLTIFFKNNQTDTSYVFSIVSSSRRSLNSWKVNEQCAFFYITESSSAVGKPLKLSQVYSVEKMEIICTENVCPPNDGGQKIAI